MPDPTADVLGEDERARIEAVASRMRDPGLDVDALAEDDVGQAVIANVVISGGYRRISVGEAEQALQWVLDALRDADIARLIVRHAVSLRVEEGGVMSFSVFPDSPLVREARSLMGLEASDPDGPSHPS